MPIDDLRPATVAGRPARRLTVAATFTAEPLEDSLIFWMGELDFPTSVEFAPYNQVFQQMLDPGSLLSQNRQGVNVALVRLEDWVRACPGSTGRLELQEYMDRNADDLIVAARAAAARSTAPLIVGLCPDSPATRAGRDMQALLAGIEERIAAELGNVPGLCLLRPDDFERYPVADYDDPRRDQLGHIPYTPLFFAALGTILARKVHALLSPPHKVVVLDCDNTLWKGVVGEEGIEGIAIPPAWMGLQRFMVDLTDKGFLLCLCSKNDEPDVLEVLERRPDMLLRRNHLISWRINWQPKSRNIRSLAQELNLGLDSFIFLDDNPVECAEVRSGCPEVLTLRLPIDGDIGGFLDHVWAFDRLRVTSEDRQRTAMYKQEAERARFQRQAPTIEEFLAGLDLRIEIAEPADDQVARVAQLTQRTNQFNFTTARRNDGEIRRLGESGLECRTVQVSDRFGDYGLVGVMIFGDRGESLDIDTLLLSCRVLGRGVEHRMLSELGEIARDRGLARVGATLIPTRKNQPARDFLDRVAAPYRREIEGTARYDIPAAMAAAIALSHIGDPLNDDDDVAAAGTDAVAASGASAPADAAGPGPERKSSRFERITAELSRPEQILEAISARAGGRRARSQPGRPIVAPRNEVESVLAAIWAGLLRLEPVGVHDNFFDLGGTSLLAVDLFAQIGRRLGKALPLTSLIEAPSIEDLARIVSGETDGNSLVLIREGGDRPPLFLVHDGDGETMLYRNLALRLKSDHAIYGLQPFSRRGLPLAHSRITDMAAYHVGKIRSVQPHGPYLLGGMCAGGVIAFEIARQLQGQGEKVAMVALLDAADVEAPLKAWRIAGQRLQRFGGVFRDGGSGRPGRRVLTVLANAFKKIRNTGVFMVGDRLKRARDEVRMRLLRIHLDRGRPLPRLLEKISVRTIYQFAERDYRPDGQFEGRLTLFRATCGVGNDAPCVESYDDPLLGWNRRASRGVHVHDSPGGHASMLQEPDVQVLAEQMQSTIDAALADEPSMSAEPALAANDPQSAAHECEVSMN